MTQTEERIEPAEREPAPNMSWCGPYPGIWSPRGTPHHGICSCSDCYALKRSHAVTVVPFAVLDPAARAKGEPTATIEYGGVRIEIGHTFLRSVMGAIQSDVAKSFYGESLAVLVRALGEIERRMWNSYDRVSPQAIPPKEGK